MLTSKQRKEILADYNEAVQFLNMTIIEIQWALHKGRYNVLCCTNPWMMDEAFFLRSKDHGLVGPARY